VVEGELQTARRHAAGLLPLLDRMLARGRVSLDRLAGVLVSDGPGSFTGLRVGASVAKAIAHARGLPLAVAPSLMVRAAAHAANGAAVFAFSNALRGEIYAAIYRFPPGSVESLLPPSVWRPDELVRRVPRPDVLVGDGPAEVVAGLESWSGRSVAGLPAAWPRAAELFDLRRRVSGATVIPDVEHWEPEYGRPAEAQARWEQIHGRPLPNSARDQG
jgi:tRNA threonylcarbamoyladenosine biosynthesis protein TsaB